MSLTMQKVERWSRQFRTVVPHHCPLMPNCLTVPALGVTPLVFVYSQIKPD